MGIEAPRRCARTSPAGSSPVSRIAAGSSIRSSWCGLSARDFGSTNSPSTGSMTRTLESISACPLALVSYEVGPARNAAMWMDQLISKGVRLEDERVSLAGLVDHVGPGIQLRQLLPHPADVCA